MKKPCIKKHVLKSHVFLHGFLQGFDPEPKQTVPAWRGGAVRRGAPRHGPSTVRKTGIGKGPFPSPQGRARSAGLEWTG